MYDFNQMGENIYIVAIVGLCNAHLDIDRCDSLGLVSADVYWRVSARLFKKKNEKNKKKQQQQIRIKIEKWKKC